MLPDDDMLRAFIADTLTREEEHPSSQACDNPYQGGEKHKIREMASAPVPSMKRRGMEASLKSILITGLLILVIFFVWFVVSK
ncbi:MAG: hypothetical protein WBN92_14810 [Terriglobia bacterium]